MTYRKKAVCGNKERNVREKREKWGGVKCERGEVKEEVEAEGRNVHRTRYGRKMYMYIDIFTLHSTTTNKNVDINVLRTVALF